MASLRGRLLVGVLALTAVGTPPARRHHLRRAALVPVRARRPAGADGALRRSPASSQEGSRASVRGPGRGPRTAATTTAPPPGGTYGQLRDPAGNVVAAGPSSARPTDTAKPDLPAKIEPGKLFTVGGTDTRYRVYAEQDPDTGYIAVVAVPLREVDQNLHRLLLVEGLVIAGVLLALGLAAWAIVRVGLLPLDRMGHTASSIAGGDLSHRVESTDPRTEVGRLGIALNAMLDRLESAFAKREAERGPPAPVHRRRLARAAHAARVDPRLRRAVPHGRRQRPGGDGAGDAAHRGRGDAHGRARGGPADAGAPGRAPRRPAHRRRPRRARPRRRRRRARDRARPRDRRPERARPRCSATPTSCARCSATSCATRSSTRPEGTPIEVGVEREDGRARLTVRDHGPGLPTDDPHALFERFWRAEGGRERGRAGAGLGLAIVAAIVDAHDGEVEAVNAPGGGAAFVVRLPLSESSQPAPTPLRRGSPTLGA